MKLPVKIGIGTAPREMTREQALRYGNKIIDPMLKRAGFVCIVSQSDPELHGGLWFRINYGK